LGKLAPNPRTLCLAVVRFITRRPQATREIPSPNKYARFTPHSKKQILPRSNLQVISPALQSKSIVTAHILDRFEKADPQPTDAAPRDASTAWPERPGVPKSTRIRRAGVAAAVSKHRRSSLPPGPCRRRTIGLIHE
jgi:hypothetical protein